MDKATHPDMQELMGFAETPNASEYASVALHLVSCQQCRSQVAAYKKTLSHLKENPTILSSTLDEQQHHLNEIQIAQYVDKTINEEAYQSLKQHVDSCNACLKAALTYASHSQPVKSSDTATLGDAEGSLSGWFGKLKDKINDSFSAVMAVPVTAAVTAAVTLAILPGISNRSDIEAPIVASYQDSPYMTFSSSDASHSGIGFFGEAAEEKKAFTGMQISITTEKSYLFTWPSVEHATHYELTLYTIEDEARQMVAQVDAGNDNRAVVSESLMYGKRYEWVLRGDTADNRQFSTRGGFVLSQTD